MSQELFYTYSTIGIVLTFLASMTAVVVSLVSMSAAKQTAKQTNYQNIISVGRAKWQADLREASTKYFAQIARLCGGQEFAVDEIFNELTLSHFAIVLLIFKQDKRLHDEMSAIRDKAYTIVDCHNFISSKYLEAGQDPKVPVPEIESKDVVSSIRSSIYQLRLSILNDHQHKVFDEIRELIENEWRKQQFEATEMWERHQK